MSRHTPRISHKPRAEKGWVRVDPRPWGKLNAQWKHRDGWWLEHCGHPTALWPWALYDPKGRMHCMGLALGGTNPTFGYAFSDLFTVAKYVDEMGARAIRAMDWAWLQLSPSLREKRFRRAP